MARYRMTPRRRAALRKAQAVSARKRRGSGKVGTHLRKHGKKYVAGVAVAAVLAGGAAAGHNKHTKRTIARKSAAAPKATRSQIRRAKISMAKKGGMKPEGKNIVLTHRTRSKSGAAKIARTRRWKTDLQGPKSGGIGKEGHVWFSNQHHSKGMDSAYGKHKVKVVVPRKKVIRHSPMGAHKPGDMWYMVDAKHLSQARTKVVSGKRAPGAKKRARKSSNPYR